MLHSGLRKGDTIVVELEAETVLDISVICKSKCGVSFSIPKDSITSIRPKGIQAGDIVSDKRENLDRSGKSPTYRVVHIDDALAWIESSKKIGYVVETTNLERAL